MVKAAIDDIEMSEQGCMPVELYLQKQVVGPMGPIDCNLLTPGLYDLIISNHSM